MQRIAAQRLRITFNEKVSNVRMASTPTAGFHGYLIIFVGIDCPGSRTFKGKSHAGSASVPFLGTQFSLLENDPFPTIKVLGKCPTRDQ